LDLPRCRQHCCCRRIWQHIAVVISSEDAEARFFINGVQTGSDFTYSGLGDELALGANIRVGAGKGANPERTFIGVLDEVRIWNTARTEYELLENMNKEIDPATEGLLMYYQCNEEVDAIEMIDATGNGYNLLVAEDAFGYEFVEDTEWNTETNSVKRTKNADFISSFPNPVKDQLFIKGIDVHNAEVEIHDVLGHLIERKVAVSSALNVSNLKSGLYFFSLKKGQEIYRCKFSKE